MLNDVISVPQSSVGPYSRASSTSRVSGLERNHQGLMIRPDHMGRSPGSPHRAPPGHTGHEHLGSLLQRDHASYPEGLQQVSLGV